MKPRSVGAGSSGEGSPEHLAAMETNVFTALPNLTAHCAITRYDNGSPRRPGWFTVKTQGSAWVIQLKEPDSALQMTCHGQTLDDALSLAELLLGADSAPWEPDPFLKRTLGGKGNK